MEVIMRTWHMLRMARTLTHQDWRLETRLDWWDRPDGRKLEIPLSQIIRNRCLVMLL